MTHTSTPVTMLSGSLTSGTSHIMASHYELTIPFPVDDMKIHDIMGAFWETAMGDNNPESDFEEDGDPDGNEEDGKVMEVSALEYFETMLQRAQDAVVAAERARECRRKRPKCYLRNSVRGQQRFHQRRCELVARGFLSIEEWFKKKPASTGNAKPSGNATSVDESSRHNHLNTSDSEVNMDGQEPEGQSDGDVNLGIRVDRGALGRDFCSKRRKNLSLSLKGWVEDLFCRKKRKNLVSLKLSC